MRRSLAAVIALLAFFPFLPAGTAHAGGPTSVLLVDPSTGRTASLYLTDPAYDDLARLVGAYGSGPVADSGGKPAPDGSEKGRAITATWLIHDVSVWRVDRILLDVPGGPMLETQTSDSDGDIWSAAPVRHAPANGQELSALLTRLGLESSLTGSTESRGVVGDVSSRQGQAGAAGSGSGTTDDAAAVAGTSAATSAGASADTSAAASAAWGAGGLLVGVLLALGTTSSLRRRHPGRAIAAPAKIRNWASPKVGHHSPR